MKARSRYWQIIPYLKPEQKRIVLALVCTLLFTIFWPLLAWLAGRMANFIGQGDVQSLSRLAIAAAVIFLLRGIVQYGQDSLMAASALNIALELRKNVFSHLQRLSLSYFQSSQTGDLSYRLTEDIDRIGCLLYTSPSPRDLSTSRMPSSA